jgi:hypothetical protein
MMKLLSSRIFWGLALIVVGILILLDTLGIFGGGDLFWTVITVVGALLFFSVFVMNRDHWWALIPGTIFLSISATIGLNSFLPGFSEKNLGKTILLGGVALSFLLVYFADRSNWWAIIPMGIISTIAIVSMLDTNSTNLVNIGGIFFLGLGITFALVALLPLSTGKMLWAWIPAGILGGIGLILLLAAEEYINYIWPSALILGGIILIGRSLTRNKSKT